MSEKVNRRKLSAIAVIGSLALVGCGPTDRPVQEIPTISDASASSTEVFRIPQIADTQYAVAYKSPDFMRTIGWVASNIDKQNIKFVIQNGDLVNQSSRRQKNLRDQEYVTASSGMAQLDGKICYSIAIGNHDLDAWPTAFDGDVAIAADRSAQLYNAFFPYKRFQDQGCLRNSYPTGKTDNYYQEFSAGGTDYGVLTLKYEPTPDEIAWANSIVSAHADRRFIINTHSYMHGDSTLSKGGHIIWDGLAKQHDNIQLILSGHTGPTAHNTHITDSGSPVQEIMMDYQSLDNPDMNTYIRMLTFDPSARTISAVTYSPILDRYMDDPANAFTLTNVPFGPA